MREREGGSGNCDNGNGIGSLGQRAGEDVTLQCPHHARWIYQRMTHHATIGIVMVLAARFVRIWLPTAACQCIVQMTVVIASRNGTVQMLSDYQILGSPQLAAAVGHVKPCRNVTHRDHDAEKAD